MLAAFLILLAAARRPCIVLVAEDEARACASSNRIACLFKGRVTLAGAPRDSTRERIAAAYFGE